MGRGEGVLCLRIPNLLANRPLYFNKGLRVLRSGGFGGGLDQTGSICRGL